MGTRDSRVDAYIANAPEFARPILEHLRKIVHNGCPDVSEAIKWGTPFFVREGLLCNMAAFKAHCSFNFWRGSRIIPKVNRRREAMGQFGRITSVKDLPSEKVLLGYVKEAARLDETGIKGEMKPPKPKPKPAAVAPGDLIALLKKNEKAAATFERFSPSRRREYIEWITEAKREETRQKRLEQTIAWLAEGKSRNWKYETR